MVGWVAHIDQKQASPEGDVGDVTPRAVGLIRRNELGEGQGEFSGRELLTPP